MIKSKFTFPIYFFLFCTMFQSCTEKDVVESTTTIFENVVWQNDVNPNFKTVELNVETITQDIVNRGAVFVYGSNDKQLWDVLPKSSSTKSLWFEHKLNYIRVLYNAPSQIFEQNSQYTYLKVVTVSGD